jgi:hypothetical protein
LLTISSPPNRSKHDGEPKRLNGHGSRSSKADTGKAARYANKETRQSGLIVAVGVAEPSPTLCVELS